MPAVELTGFCILDRNSQKAKFSFTIHDFSGIVHQKSSKLFHFAGHFWKLQVTKKDDHFGMFLRWYGTKTGYDGPLQFDCKASMLFAVLNVIEPLESVSEGCKKDKDLFQVVGGGIGYGKILSLSDLNNTPGYIINNALNVQVALKVLSTTYYDKIPSTRQADKDFIQGMKFPFFGTTWYIILFPEGENPDDIVKNKESKASIYLMRDSIEDNFLRHNVSFKISVDGGGDVAVDQHFYNCDSNVYGTASFMPVTQLKRIGAKGYLRVAVTFHKLVPYFYLAYEVSSSPIKLGDGFHFRDHYKFPWFFKLSVNEDTDNVQGTIVLDPNGEDRTVKKLIEKNRGLQVSWLVEFISPADIEKNLISKRRGRRPLQEKTLYYSGESDSIDFPISLEKVRRYNRNKNSRVCSR